MTTAILLSSCRAGGSSKTDSAPDTTNIHTDTDAQCGLGEDTGTVDTGNADTEPEFTEVDKDTVRYLFVEAHMTWPEAAAMCEAEGLTLVTVDDAEENTWLHTEAWGKGRIKNPAWIGYHDDGGGWRWPDGSTGGFEAFSGEVLVDKQGSALTGDGAAMADPGAAVWQQAPGTWAYAAICEGEAVDSER